ncbi:MAG: hypothetical protein HY010_20725 [Acidobacteria bacterium]|nr:hypothetical protein [Acidobacteriota bacterium]
MSLDERAGKGSHADTILYEIDMLRQGFSTHPEKRKRVDAGGSLAARGEYYLSIEGFLLHARNLLAFFTNRKNEMTDLIINEPEVWYGKAVDPREYSGLIKAMKEVDTDFGEDGKKCYDQISKFLMHCTTMRYERTKQWDLEGMFKRIDPILEEFKTRFTPSTKVTVYRGRANASTATMNVVQTILDPSKGKS